MRKLAHRLFGHHYVWSPDAGTPIFDCDCGQDWFIGFGLGVGPTRRDTFTPFRVCSR